MNISAPFIRRPVATTLLTIAVAIAGAIGFTVLPVSPLPQVDFPTIQVQAGLPGASAQIMASSVATPLERQLGHIAGVSEMTSSSSLGRTSVTLQFDLRLDQHHSAVRSESRYRRRGARCRSRDQRCSHLSAGQPARQSDLS
jgi:multidrug efflux pump